MMIKMCSKLGGMKFTLGGHATQTVPSSDFALTVRGRLDAGFRLGFGEPMLPWEKQQKAPALSSELCLILH